MKQMQKYSIVSQSFIRKQKYYSEHLIFYGTLWMALGKSQNKMLFLRNDGSLATGQGTTGKTSEFQVVIEPTV